MSNIPMKVKILKQPLSVNQVLVDRVTGDAWKVEIVEAMDSAGQPAERNPLIADEVIYLYGCVAMERDDERVVFEDEIGRKFEPVEHFSSAVSMN